MNDIGRIGMSLLGCGGKKLKIQMRSEEAKINTSIIPSPLCIWKRLQIPCEPIYDLTPNISNFKIRKKMAIDRYHYITFLKVEP